ncbi:MAG TPA: DUF6585 family protein [Ktedonobacteraceae bacterium]|jgi:hypothetical protein
MHNIYSSEHKADDMLRLAREQQLGEPLGAYEVLGLARNWRARYLLLSLALGTGFVFLLIGVLPIFFKSNDPTFNLPLPLLICVLCYHLILQLLVFLTPTSTIYTLCVYTEGCVLKKSQKKFRVIRWQEIEHIWHMVAHVPRSLFKVYRLYTLQSHDGSMLRFCGKMPVLSELDQRIDEHYTQRRLPAYLDDYQAGHLLRFGSLTLNLDGIALDHRTLVWEQIADISLQKKRWLIIRATDEQQTPWLRMAVGKIPDLPLLLALLAHLRPALAVHAAFPALSTSQGEQAAMQESGHPLLSKPLAAREPWPVAQKLRRRLTEIPDDLLALAHEHRLGEKRTDGPSGRSMFTAWPSIVSQAIPGLIFTVIFFIIDRTLLSPPSSASDWEQIQDAIMRGIIWFSIGVTWLGCLSDLRHIHHSTYTFEQGIILKRGRKATAICRWDEVETVWRAMFLGPWPVYRPPFFAGYTLQMRNGSRLTLTRFDGDLATFSTLVQKQITALQLPAFRYAYHSGQKLSFDSLHISQAGIEHGKRLLPWSQVRSVMLEAQTLVIYALARRKPWYAVHAARVPNLYVLFALADEARGHGERSEEQAEP